MRRVYTEKIMFYESEEFYRNLIAQVKDYAIFTTDPRGVITTWTEGCKNVLGYDRDEFVGQGIKMLFTPEDVASDVPDRELRIADEKGSATDDRWMMRKGSERFWASGITTAVRDQAGNLTCFTKVVRDLTESKQLEERLRENEARLRAERDFSNEILDTLPGVFYLFDQQGKFLRWNKNLEKISGHPGDEIALMTPLEFIVEEDRPAVQSKIEEVFSTGEANIEAQMLTPNGLGIPHFFTGRRIVIDGKPCLIGAGVDVRERRRGEEVAAYLAAIVESSDDAILSEDLQGNIKSWNKGAERLYGYTAPEAIGKPMTMLLPPERWGEESRILELIKNRDRIDHYETIRQRKDGTDINISLTVSPILSAEGDVVGASKTSRDITWRKRAEEERERLLTRERDARSEAEEANRLKDEFLATISHELRSPLNAILGWARLLRAPQVQEDQLERALEIIERNAQAQARLIEDLLDVSRIVSGKLSVQMRPVTLNSTAESVLADIRPDAEAKGIDLRMVEDDEIKLLGDADRLQQVVWNLLSNAIKFTPEGGRIEVGLRRVGESAEMRVSDTGRGINPEFLPYVFDRFRQATRADARARAGLGLGLTIVRYIVEAHGGSVTAESDGVGLGATFICKLPMAGAEQEVIPAIERQQAQLKVSATPSLSDIKVLVVDDDEDAREMLRAALSSYGAKVTTASGALQALDVLVSEKMDVLVSDINMPEIDGYELIKRVRAMKPEQGGRIPAIALTAYARAEDRLRALQSGYQTHVPKPVEPAELEVVVATLAKSFKGYD